MAERRSFQDKQYAFAAHIRDPEHMPAPDGVEDRRMAIYRQLFFNNLRNLLATFFPVLKKIHSKEHWNRFIRQFMQHHHAKTPYFLKLPEEFLSFLQDEYEPQADDFPFLTELAHYEYVELALSVDTASNDFTDVDSAGDLLTGVPVKSALAWAFAYQYPVHRISPDYLPSEELQQPAFLVVYRRDDDSVGFLELNTVTANLLSAIEENSTGQSGEQLLRGIAAAINYQDADAFVGHGRAALDELRDHEILIGTRSA